MRGDIAGVKYKSGRFWGVTRQRGPWESTPTDKKRDDGVQVRKAGGGIGIGNENSGNRNSRQVVNPYTVDATKAPSTKYFQQSIVYKKDYKPGSTAVGKKKLPSEQVGLLKKILASIKKEPGATYPVYGATGSPPTDTGRALGRSPDDPYGKRSSVSSSGSSSSGSYGTPYGSSPSIQSSDSPLASLQDTNPGMLERLTNGLLPNSMRRFGF